MNAAPGARETAPMTLHANVLGCNATVHAAHLRQHPTTHGRCHRQRAAMPPQGWAPGGRRIAHVQAEPARAGPADPPDMALRRPLTCNKRLKFIELFWW